MATSDVTITFDSLPSAYVRAVGGTRRERGAAIAAAVRGKGWGERLFVSYSETYGFQTMTEARYRTTAPSACHCGEATRWATYGDEALRWGGQSAHTDGEPLCPVSGPTGYVPADHPSVRDTATV